MFSPSLGTHETEFNLGLFAARGLVVDEPSADRFLGVDALVGSEPDWDGIRDEAVGVDMASGCGCFGRHCSFSGGEAWFAAGSTHVPHVNHNPTRNEPEGHLPFTTNLGIFFPSHMRLSYGLTLRAWRGFAR